MYCHCRRERDVDVDVLSIRLVLHNSKRSDLLPEQTNTLNKLYNITVINVPTITTTLSIGSCKETTSEDVACEEADDKFTVFVSNAGSIEKSSNPICAELSRLLELDMMNLFTCIMLPVNVVNSFFEFNGIPDIPVDDGHDRTWLQAMTQPNVPIVPTPVVPERSLSPAPSQSPPPYLPTTVSVHDEFPALSANPPRTLRSTPSLPSLNSRPPSSNGRRRQRSVVRNSVAVSEHSQFVQSSRSSHNSGSLQAAGPTNAARDMNRLTAQMAALMNVNQIVPNSLAGPVWPPMGNFNAPVSTEETDMVGIMGEHFVRCVFTPIVPR